MSRKPTPPRPPRSAACLALAALALAGPSRGQAATLQTIDAFTGGADGSASQAGLILDAAGALYGTAQLGGTAKDGVVFRLVAPASGSGPWTETVLHSFSGVADGKAPEAGLVMDAAGALYGTTYFGGGKGGCDKTGCGTVFKLTPPPKGQAAWGYQLLHRFTGGADGAEPEAAVILDAKGALYGTTLMGGAGGSGVVFRLAPPAKAGGSWAETVLHAFTGGNDGGSSDAPLIMDAAGALYGTTYFGGTEDGGVAFKLSPPAKAGGNWSESVLYSFGVVDPTGPSGGKDGTAPNAGLLFGPNGVLYGTTSTGGTDASAGVAFQLTPPAAGKGAWTETVLHAFTGGQDGSNPDAALIMDKAGALYGTAYQGGKSVAQCDVIGTGCGVVFKLVPPKSAGGAWTETVLWTLSGKPDGLHPDAPLLADAKGALYSTTSGSPGFGSYGTVFKLTP